MTLTQANTLQKIDPLATLTNWDAAVALSLGTWVYAILASLVDLSRGHNDQYLIIAMGLLTLGLFLHLWFAVPRHAPYTRTRYIIVVLLVVAAGSLQILSHQDIVHIKILDWGPIAVSLVLATASGYRPLIDQYLAGLFTVVVLSTFLIQLGLEWDLSYGLPYFVLSEVAIIILVVVGQASYTRKALKILYSWLGASVLRNEKDTSQVTLKSLENAEEFLIKVLEKGTVTRADIKTSQEVAAQVRQELLTASSQSWLEHAGYTVTDPQSVLDEWAPPAQSTMLAFLDRLKELGLLDIQVSVTQENSPRRISVVVLALEEAHDALTVNKLRSLLSPYLRVMYVVFDHVRLISDDGTVKVMFYYVR